MHRSLNTQEISILRSVNEHGQIVIPCGSAVEIDTFHKTLMRLERIGLVVRISGKSFYRPFVLTREGNDFLAEFLSRKENEARG